jgi:hypothetical protein
VVAVFKDPGSESSYMTFLSILFLTRRQKCRMLGEAKIDIFSVAVKGDKQ